MTRVLLLPLLLVLLSAPSLTLAQIYKSTDEQGNVSFSDVPSNGSETEQVKLPQTNTLAAPERSESSNQAPGSSEPTMEAITYSVAITSPAHETTFPMGPGNFSVSASATPPLAAGQLLQLLIDGSPFGEPQVGGSWSLTNVFRGAHDLTVAVVADGKTLASSDPVRVYVLRPSVNFRK
jgi:hypothetical protein